MKKLTLENRNELAPYITLADYNEYNSNIVTMLMWSSMYEVHFETFEHFALVYTKMPNRSAIWMMPYCERQYRKEAIDKLKELSALLGINYEIHSMTSEFKNWLQTTYPDEFLIWDCYNARDYVYDRKQQQSLAGKKMQKRRNHFHAFEKMYEGRYQYKSIDKNDIPNIYAFLKKWQSRKDHDDSIEAEQYGIERLLSHMDILPIEGGCIYVDGILEAFNITSRLSKDTVQIHVEKANKNIRGLYIAILKLYLETLDDDILYINREDDLGLPELRKAKTDMQPIHKIKKFGCIYQKVEVRKASAEDMDHIVELWKARFDDENDISTAYFFEHLFDINHTYVLTSGNELISMIQTRPMKIMLNGSIEEGSLIFGVATNQDYEGCSYMKRLMHYVIDDLKNKQRFLFLQAYHWEVYDDFDFEEAYWLTKTKLDKNVYLMSNGVNDDHFETKELLSLYQNYTKDKNGYRIRDLSYYECMIAYYAVWKEHYVVHRNADKADAYMRLAEQDDAIIVKECVYDNTEALDAMLSILCKQDKKVYVYMDIYTTLAGRSKKELHMKVKTFDQDAFTLDKLFINEEL